MPKKTKIEVRGVEKSYSLYRNIREIIDNARNNIARSVNHEMVKVYWLIGKAIVEEEQKGRKRAEYGDKLINILADKLCKEYGNGFSISSLKDMRQFYLLYGKSHAVRGFFKTSSNIEPNNKNLYSLRIELSWTHYRTLMRVTDSQARSFYEIECIKNNWSTRELERQIGSFLFERLALSKNKKAVMKMAHRGQEIAEYRDIIKDPYVLEFTGLRGISKLYESDLEQSLVDNLSRFLLELGRGFTFVARQKRITLDGEHFYIDLVFYNTILRCYVLIDLKTGKLTHQDIGQMQMYVHYYDRELINKDDSPTVGLILCGDKKEAVVRYTLTKENRQIFASKYRLYLPTKKELARICG